VKPNNGIVAAPIIPILIDPLLCHADDLSFICLGELTFENLQAPIPEGFSMVGRRTGSWSSAFQQLDAVFVADQIASGGFPRSFLGAGMAMVHAKMVSHQQLAAIIGRRAAARAECHVARTKR
jgi:hypothetical protein